VDASLPAPRPAALDLSLTCWVLVTGERRALFLDSAPPGTLVAFSLLFFCRPESSPHCYGCQLRKTIAVSFIPLRLRFPRDDDDGTILLVTIAVNASVGAAYGRCLGYHPIALVPEYICQGLPCIRGSERYARHITVTCIMRVRGQ
jgi:hypothetical protein